MNVAARICLPPAQPSPDGPILAATSRLSALIEDLAGRLDTVLKPSPPVAPSATPETRSYLLNKLETAAETITHVLGRLDV